MKRLNNYLTENNLKRVRKEITIYSYVSVFSLILLVIFKNFAILVFLLEWLIFVMVKLSLKATGLTGYLLEKILKFFGKK